MQVPPFTWRTAASRSRTHTSCSRPRCGVHRLLSALHEAVHGGELPASTARDHLAYLGRLRVRLLGDAVLRKVAWEVADELGWATTYDAEYFALTKLQADALSTLQPELARRAESLVPIAPIEALQ